MASAGANRVLDAARDIQDFCTGKGWKFCFIGAIAVQRWGEPRLTRDADLSVFTGIGEEPDYIDQLVARFAGRIDNARDFALQHRVLLLRAANGVPIDISLGALEFEEQAAANATLEEIAPGAWLRIASPSALIVFKTFADRPQDWIDVEGVIARSAPLIDWPTVDAQLRVLLDLKGDDVPLTRLLALRERLGVR